MDDNLLRPKEAAKVLGVTTQSLANWERSGKIFVKRTPGGHRRIPESEVRRLLGGSHGRTNI